MSRLCRLCLNRLTENTNYSIFEHEKVPEMILACASLQVEKGDGLPEFICATCWKELKQCFQFREQCRESEKILRKALEMTKGNKKILLQTSDTLGEGSKSEETECESTNQFPLEERKRESNQSDNTSLSETWVNASHDDEEDSQDSLKKVSKRKNDSVKKTFPCQYCSKVYPSLGGWRYHVHICHSKSYRPFICDICGKFFKVKCNLTVHKKTVHFGLKDELCDLCGRGFSTKYALRVHKMWHTGEKNFSCDQCGNKFSSMSKLKIHKTVHGGPKPFMCDVCSRAFRWKKTFEIHMRTHTGEKPYPCCHCRKAFSVATNRSKHEKTCKSGPGRLAAARDYQPVPEVVYRSPVEDATLINYGMHSN